MHVLLRSEGWEINTKRVYRLYTELGPQRQHKTPKRCIKAKQREGYRPVLETNETWGPDVFHDQLVFSMTSCLPTIVDTLSHYAPAIVPRLWFQPPDVVEVSKWARAEWVGAEIGLPQMTCVAQGSEFVSPDLDLWA